jgi:hypothetical protein
VSNKKKRSQPGDRTVQTYKKKQQETKEEEEEDQCIIEDDAGDFDGEVDAAPAAPSPKRRKTNRGAAAKLPSTKANGGELPGGVAHALPSEFASLLRSNSTLRSLWSTSLTPLMRNEWICWAQSAAQEATRDKRRQRMQEALLHEGKRRPCCWPGCKHREKSK